MCVLGTRCTAEWFLLPAAATCVHTCIYYVTRLRPPVLHQPTSAYTCISLQFPLHGVALTAR